MKKIICLLLIGFLISCNPVRWCSKRIPTIIRDSLVIKDSISIHTDTIFIKYHVPSDSITLANKLYTVIDSLGKCKIQNTQGIVESNKIKVKYIIRNDSILIEAATKPYEIKIAQLNTTIEYFKERYKSHYEKQSPVACKNPSWFGYWQTWVALAFIGFVLVKNILRFFKLKIRLSITPPFISIQ